MSNDLQGASTHSTIPVEWTRTPTFNDLLYEWMERAPWLTISLLAHFVLFLLLTVIPWNLFEKEELKVVYVSPEAMIENILEEPPPEVIPEVATEDPLEEPSLNEADASEPTESPASDDFAPEDGDPEMLGDVDLAFTGSNDLIGVGGNAGGRYGGRFNGGGGGSRGSIPRAEIDRGLEWLALHQDADGKWDSDEFMKHDPPNDHCEGPGRAEHDVGLTGLALLAFMGNGNTTNEGKYRDQVARGLQWLKAQQDFESGLIGEKVGTAFLYDHSIATLALCEAYYFSESPVLHGYAQRAVSFCSIARNPYGAWRYSVPASGSSDTSVTGWMVFAMESARQAGLTVDSQAFPDSITWFDEVTDPRTGRVGYDSIGSPSARVTGTNDHYATNATEAMTAVALLCRFFLGQNPDDEPRMRQHADLLLRQLPRWSEDGQTNDVYYWYYGTYAMYQMGGKYWKAWNKAMKPAIVESQCRSGSARGSWDPNGPWGMVGGRVYSTAMMVLSLEVYFRYSRVLGAR